MYEKPQYLTTDGFKRTQKNPVKKKQRIIQPPLNKGISIPNQMAKVSLKPQRQRGISKEAAKIIAQAIKGLLKG